MCTLKQHFYDKSIMFGEVGEAGKKTFCHSKI